MSDATIAAPERREVPVPAPRPVWRWWIPVALFVAVASVVWCAAAFGAEVLPRHELYPEVGGSPGGVWFEAWARWDGYWYRAIVRDGYEYYPGVQSSVAFFPAYPLLVGWLSWLFPSVFVTGVVTTAASGLGAAVLFHRWCRDRMGPTAATTALAVLLLYPYAWFLFGAVYADALALAAALGAFVALERDRPWLAGICAMVAASARPVGIVVALAVVLRLLELRSASRPDARAGRGPLRGLVHRWDPRALCRRDIPVFAGFAGFAAWCTYLWVRFGDPFLFSTIQGVSGWDQPEGPATWFKVRLLEELVSDRSYYTLGKLLQGGVAVAMLVAVPRIARRFGWAYGVLVAGVVLVPILGTKDFVGTGRYVLLAFPAFALAGEWLAGRPRLRAGWLGATGLLLVVLTAQFARGSYLS